MSSTNHSAQSRRPGMEKKRVFSMINGLLLKKCVFFQMKNGLTYLFCSLGGFV